MIDEALKGIQLHLEDNFKPLKMLGISREMISKQKALRVLGVSDLDYVFATRHNLFDSCAKARQKVCLAPKPQKILGIAAGEMGRSKALRVLGISHDAYSNERERHLSKLGHCEYNSVGFWSAHKCFC
eukprot:TRINITY_DN14131_c0_g1_i1.p1 TRINITY_DN14131_c0_g1~~TRINITY_DN14131_c0_g1_i1.p1  ORF type:complete len:128 (-),score=20.74 TRINITY_DN14131_c0_g1_i1:372-755(-)